MDAGWGEHVFCSRWTGSDIYLWAVRGLWWDVYERSKIDGALPFYLKSEDKPWRNLYKAVTQGGVALRH